MSRLNSEEFQNFLFQSKLAFFRLMLYLLTSVIGMLWILFDKENRCLPDKILGLKVIKKRGVS